MDHHKIIYIFFSQILSPKLFSPLDRANILHNVFVDGYTKRTNYATVVDVLAYLSNERDYLPWQTLFKHANDLFKVLDYKRSFEQVSVSLDARPILRMIK